MGGQGNHARSGAQNKDLSKSDICTSDFGSLKWTFENDNDL